MNDLLDKKCVPCEGGVKAFDISEIHKYQKKVDGWEIVQNDKKIYLLEKSKKKCYFLNKTIDLLGLKNAKVLNTVISKNNNLGSYTLITARAFSSTTNILELTQKNLDDGGKYVLLKGKKEKIIEELTTIDTNKYKYEIIKLENKKYERHLLEIRKSE